MRRIYCLLLSFVFLLGVGSVFAKDIVVPRDYDLIQDAIDEAEPGDDVKVLPGIYTENVTMRDGINLIGSGPDVTTIVAVQEGPPGAVVYCSEDAIFEGFTVTGARGKPGHAIMVKDVSTRLRNLIVRDNAYTGIGIHNAKASPVVENCKIHNNGGPGIANNYGASATIKGNDIYGNTRAGIGNVGSATVVIGNYIHDNELAGVGTISCSGLVIRGNKIENNGGVEIAVLAVEGAPPKKEAIIEKNEINGSGGPPSIICENTSPFISDNVITNRGSTGIMVIASSVVIASNDISTDGPAGVYVKTGATPTIENNSILGGGVRGIVGDISEAQLSNNQIKTDGILGGGMMMGGGMGMPPGLGVTQSVDEGDGPSGGAFPSMSPFSGSPGAAQTPMSPAPHDSNDSNANTSTSPVDNWFEGFQ